MRREGETETREWKEREEGEGEKRQRREGETVGEEREGQSGKGGRDSEEI